MRKWRTGEKKKRGEKRKKKEYELVLQSLLSSASRSRPASAPRIWTPPAQHNPREGEKERWRQPTAFLIRRIPGATCTGEETGGERRKEGDDSLPPFPLYSSFLTDRRSDPDCTAPFFSFRGKGGKKGGEGGKEVTRVSSPQFPYSILNRREGVISRYLTVQHQRHLAGGEKKKERGRREKK